MADEVDSASQTKSQADLKFPDSYRDRKYFTSAQLKKDELINRLTRLHKFLKKVGQAPEWDKKELDETAAALIQNDRLRHANKDVRLLVACALADIIRIYAPDAPYDDDALKGIFELFINEMACLGQTDDAATHSLRFYLMERLQSVRAFALLIDLNEQLYMSLYETFFEVVSENTQSEVINQMLDIMTGCLEESDEISQDLLEKILANLLPEQKEARPSAFRLAQALIKGNAQLLEAPITHFMHDILVNVKASSSELKDHGHELIWELNKISPNLLLYVLPELEKELTVEDEAKRQDTVELLGRMFAADGSRMINSYPQLFAIFLKRFNDVEPVIRRKMVEYATEFIKNMPALDLADSLFTRIRDPDESVRGAAVSAICAAASANPILFKKDILQEVGLRLRDKKPAIRRQAMTRLARLYRDLWNRTWDDDERKKIEKSYGWIPTKILHLYFQADVDIKTDVDEILSWELLSRDKNVKERTQELLDMLPSFDANAHDALARLLKDKRAFQLQFIKYLDERKNDPGAKDKNAKVGPEVAECFRVFQQFISVPTARLQAFHATKQKEIWTALRELANEETEFKRIKKAVDMLHSQAKSKSGKGKTATSGISDVLRTITYRLAIGVASRQSVPLLLISLNQYLKKHDPDYPALLTFLHETSASYPSFFADASDQLASLLEQKDAKIIDVALRMLAHVGKHGLNWPADLRHRLAELCSEGTPQQAKHAVRALHCLYPDIQKSFLPKLARTLTTHLDLSERQCGPALAALAHIAKVAPATLSSLSDSFLPWITGDLLTAQPPKRKQSDEASHQARLKALGIRLLANYTLANHSTGDDARSAVRLLLDLIRNTEPAFENEDEEDEANATSKSHTETKYKADPDRELIRRHAVGAMLRLVQVREIETMLEVEDFHLVAFTVRDPAPEVREYIIEKLWAAAKHPTKLGLRWVAMLGLAGLETDKKLLQRARGYLTNAIRARRQAVTRVRKEDERALFSILPEYALPYLIHLLAHRPDWDRDSKYQDSARFLIFFLEPIITHGDNFTFLIELLKFIKQTKDASELGQEKRLRILCDIGAMYINQRGAKATGRWLNQKRHPGDLYLPPKFFKLSEQVDERTIQDAEKSYLPPDFSLPSSRASLIYTEKTPSKAVPVSPAKKTPAKEKTPKRKRDDESEEEYDKDKKVKAKGKGAKATPKSKTQTNKRQRSTKKKEEDKVEEEEEEEEEQQETAAPAKRVAKRKRGATSKEISDNEDDESPRKKQKGAASAKGGKRKGSDDDESDEQTSKPNKGRGKAKKKTSDDEAEETASKKKGKSRAALTKGKTRGKKTSESEPEEEEELPVTHTASRRGRRR